jgi:hypothetical protein
MSDQKSDTKIIKVNYKISVNLMKLLGLRFNEEKFFIRGEVDNLYPAIYVHGKVGIIKCRQYLAFAQGVIAGINLEINKNDL